MAASPLGRGLGELLHDRTTPPIPANGHSGASTPVSAGSGVGSLLRGASRTTDAPAIAADSASTTSPASALGDLTVAESKRSGLVWSLAFGDVALVLVVWLFVRRSAGSMTWIEALLCAAAIGVAAWLGCVAVWLCDQRGERRRL